MYLNNLSFYVAVFYFTFVALDPDEDEEEEEEVGARLSCASECTTMCVRISS